MNNTSAQVSPLVSTQVQAQIKISAPSVMSDAFGAWSTYDLYGTGGNVVRLRSTASSPTERDFTAKELIDGTYTSWHVSGDTFVYKMYDQKGSNDLLNFSSSYQPKYIAAENVVQHRAVNQYVNTSLISLSSSSVGDTFDGNTFDVSATLVASMAKTGGSVGFTDRPAFGIYENAPVAYLSRHHRSIVTGGGSFSTKTGISMLTQGPPYPAFKEAFSSGFSSSLKTITAVFKRHPAPAVGTYTDLTLKEDTTQQVYELTTQLTETMNQDMFLFGDNGGIEASTLIAFPIALTNAQQKDVHDYLSRNY